MSHWSERYIGTPYELGSADCARISSRIRREVFNGDVPDELEVERKASRLGRVGQISDAVAEYGTPTDTPEEGDAVLMYCRGRPSHIGIYCEVDGEPCVVHAMENAGMVVRHYLRDLERYFLRVEGFYKWKS